ncbi:MAG TPA: anti-sigma factor [Xanthobacteraceae bacterium]|jgi:anti-sigma factor RsiW
MTGGSDDPFLLVHAYCDDELDPANALALERRMAEDPRLAAERDRIQALKRAMGRLKRAPMAPPALRAKVERAVGMRRPAVRPTWSAMAASVVLAAAISVGATWSVVTPSGNGGLVGDEVVGNHIRSLMAAQPIDVASSDQHTVKPWFNGRIPVSPRVVDLATEGFPLVGGRIDVIAQTPVPSLVYRFRKHLISLTEMQGGGAPPPERTTDGYHTIGWRAGGVTYWAVSDVDLDALQKFVKLWQAAPASEER